MSHILVDDVVQIGTGRKHWRVTGFWYHGHLLFADLQSLERQWVRTSSAVERLKRVEARP